MNNRVDKALPLLVNHSYGKRDVKVLVKVETPSGDSFRELSISVELIGGLERAYIDGENSEVLPTDSLKNHVLSLTQSSREATLEEFGVALLEQISESIPSKTATRATLSEHRWHTNSLVDGKCETSQTETPRSKCEILVTRLGVGTFVIGGEVTLKVIRGGRSSFYGFLKDGYTQQHDVFERILFGTLKCRWTYAELPLDSDWSRSRVQELLEEGFSTVSSTSVQETLYGVGALLLRDIEDLEEVEIEFRSVPLKEHEEFGAPGTTTGVWLMSGADHSFTTAKLRRNSA